LAALLLAALLLALDHPVSAQGPQRAEPAAPEADGFLESPAGTASAAPAAGEAVEPEITIREAKDRTIYEYRVRGVLYMVKIQPQFGPPYYLIDTDGNGSLDLRDNSPTNISIPQWVLFSWN